jgi:dipeptidyl aminopeptidase/acylaminoacyl peptidase
MLFIVDLPNREPRPLFPKSGPASSTVYDVAYSPNGRTLYVGTDDGGDGLHVLALDLLTGREVRRWTDPHRPGGSLHGLQARADSVAFVADLGARHEVRVLATATLRLRTTAALPLGSEVPGANHPNRTSGLSLSNDGKRIAVEWSTPSSPQRIYLVDAHTGAAQPLTNTLQAAPGMEARSVSIKSFDGLELNALVYVPSRAGAHPVLMSIHGGFPFASTARFDAQNAMWIAEGYAVVEPNVRGSAGFGRAYEKADDGAKKLDAVRDFRAVGEWIATQSWADPKRMAVMGASAGGYYTLMALAHQPELWRAGIAMVPLYDLREALSGMDGDLRFFMNRELVPPSEPRILAAISPSTYVDDIRAPLLVYAGANDVRTPTAQIEKLVRDLRSRGRAVEYMLAQGEGHSMNSPEVRAEIEARALRFLRSALE